MSEMSPLLKLIIMMVRYVCMALAGLLVLVIGVFLWQKHGANGFEFVQGDWGMMGLFAVLLAITVYLIRGFGRELLPPRQD